MELLDYDPLTGMSLYWDYKSKDEIVFRHEQDVTPVLDSAHYQANDAEQTKQGIKKDMWKYASVPPVIWMEWKQKYGVDIWSRDPDQIKAVYKLLNGDYSKFKTTSGKHQG